MRAFSLYCIDTSPSSGVPAYEVAVAISESASATGGEEVITANCATFAEVDYQIDGLICQLNRLRKIAKAKLAKNRFA